MTTETPENAGGGAQQAEPTQQTQQTQTQETNNNGQQQQTQSTQQGDGSNGEAQQQQTAEATPYKIPDAWKDKPWASKIKSEEDLYKQIDTLDALKGKKSIVPDFKTAPKEEIEAYLAGLRPADKSEYAFGEEGTFDPEFVGSVSDMLYEAGVSSYQANNVIIPKYQALERARMEAATSADGFKDVMVKSFGEKYDGVVQAVVKEHKQHLTPEDQGILDTIPNEYLGVVYRLTENMRKAYGVQEKGDAHLNKGGAVQTTDINAVRSDLRQKIAALETRPHTVQEKQKLVDELQATYSNQGAKK
jgi:hypothetical protein